MRAGINFVTATDFSEIKRNNFSLTVNSFQGHISDRIRENLASELGIRLAWTSKGRCVIDISHILKIYGRKLLWSLRVYFVDGVGFTLREWSCYEIRIAYTRYIIAHHQVWAYLRPIVHPRACSTLGNTALPRPPVHCHNFGLIPVHVQFPQII